MRLQLFCILLLGLVASSWTSSLHNPSTEIPDRDLKPDLDGATGNLDLLHHQGNVKDGLLLKIKKSSSSIQIFPEAGGEPKSSGSRKKREISKREVQDADTDCEKVSEGEIDHLITVLQGAFRNISSLYSNSNSNSTETGSSSSSLDQCQEWISEMKAVTVEISTEAELLQQNLLADEETPEIQRVEEALDLKTGQLQSLAVNLETTLNRDQNRKWRNATSRMTFEVQQLTEELNELKMEVLGPIHQIGGRNYNLLIAQIRSGNLNTANSYFSEDLLKPILQDAYDGESLDYFRETLDFARKLPLLSLDQIAYPAIFEKVNASNSSSSSDADSDTDSDADSDSDSDSNSSSSEGHRSDPRVLLPLSYRIGESIFLHERSNVSVPASLTETDQQLDQLIVEAILRPWASQIISEEGDFSPILEFEAEGSKVELNGFKLFLEALIQVAWNLESAAEDSRLEKILDFVTSLKSPRFQAAGLTKLFDLSDLLRDDGLRIAFQVKKLLESPQIRGAENSDENSEAEKIRSDLTELKAKMLNFERLAVWGGGSCHIQNYDNEEYLYAPTEEFMRSQRKRELFTGTEQQVFEPTNTGIGEWILKANEEDDGASFEIQNWAYTNESIISNGADLGRVYLREGIVPLSSAVNHTANWVVERTVKDKDLPFTIRNRENGGYLYSGGLERAWDSSHRRVLVKEELDPLSNEHLWVFKCDQV